MSRPNRPNVLGSKPFSAINAAPMRLMSSAVASRAPRASQYCPSAWLSVSAGPPVTLTPSDRPTGRCPAFAAA